MNEKKVNSTFQVELDIRINKSRRKSLNWKRYIHFNKSYWTHVYWRTRVIFSITYLAFLIE